MCDTSDVKKVFIIISEKCNCYRGLVEVDKEHVQKAGNLKAFYLTRAAIELRKYYHCLNRVTAKDKSEIHVILEFTTSLLTSNDMCKDKLADFTEEDRNTQVMAFYNKLKFILEHAHEDVGDRYKLIFISDVYKENIDTSRMLLMKLFLRHLLIFHKSVLNEGKTCNIYPILL